MKGYLGETDVSDQHDISPTDGALMFIEMYGGIDGAHHKDWVLDQIARILNGSSIRVKEAKWSCGHTELRYTVDDSPELSLDYLRWVEKVKGKWLEEDECFEYGYSEGIAP